MRRGREACSTRYPPLHTTACSIAVVRLGGLAPAFLPNQCALRFVEILLDNSYLCTMKKTTSMQVFILLCSFSVLAVSVYKTSMIVHLFIQYPQSELLHASIELASSIKDQKYSGVKNSLSQCHFILRATRLMCKYHQNNSYISYEQLFPGSCVNDMKLTLARVAEQATGLGADDTCDPPT